jgi:hypothetical protein
MHNAMDLKMGMIMEKQSDYWTKNSSRGLMYAATAVTGRIVNYVVKFHLKKHKMFKNSKDIK